MASQKEKLIAEALKLVEKGQYERAVKVYLRVVAEDDKDVRIWLKIGDLYTKLRRNSEAAQTYQHVAQVYSEQGFYTKAIAVYKQILKLDPTLVNVHERLADLYQQMGLIPDAIDQYSQVAAFHQKEGNTEGTLAALKQIVELDPHNVATRVKLAEQYSRERMVREAIDEFSRAAEHLHEQGRLDDYMKVAERLLFHSPDNRPVSRELARLYLSRGDARRALPRLQVCFKADPRDVETLALLSQAFQALGQTVKAVSVLREMARVHLENGNAIERERTLRRILELDPADAEARAALHEAPPPAVARKHIERQSAVVTPRAAPEPPAIRPAPPATPSRPTVPERPTPRKTPVVMPVVSWPTSQTPTMVNAVPPRASTGPVPRVAPVEIAAAATNGASVPPPSTPRLDAPLASADEEEIRKVLIETDVFAKYNLHAKAIEHVRTVFERDPVHAGAREKLKTLLVSAGRTREAIDELRLLARQAGGTPREQEFLDELLALDESDDWARERRKQLGDGAKAAATPGMFDEPNTLTHEMPAQFDVELTDDEFIEEQSAPIDTLDEEAFEVDAADLEEVGVEALADDEFAVVVDDAPGEQTAAVAAAEVEDRFGADLAGDLAEDSSENGAMPAVAAIDPSGPIGPIGPIGVPRLRSEPHRDDDAVTPGDLVMDEIEETGIAGPVLAAPPEQVDNFDFSSFDDPSPPALLARADQAARPPLRAAPEPRERAVSMAPAPPAEVDDEPADDAAILPGAADDGRPAEGQLADDLDEADFYIAQGMFEEAREVLQALSAAHPGDPGVRARLRDLPAASRPDAEGRRDPELVASVADNTVAARMDEVALNQEAAPPAEIVSGLPTAIGSDTAASSRRNVVDKGVGDDDFESHFDLGIAYKEMSLFDEAIAEFNIAVRDPTREVPCRQMIGLCYLGKGMTHDAVRQFKQGLHAEGIHDDEELSLYYELGLAYERLSDRPEALFYFERIRKRKARYRDIERRIEALSHPADEFGVPAALRHK